MKRKITRAELVKALSLIGIESAHSFGTASIIAVDMHGHNYKMDGESDDSYVCMIVETG